MLPNKIEICMYIMTYCTVVFSTEMSSIPGSWSSVACISALEHRFLVFGGNAEFFRRGGGEISILEILET